MSDPRAELPGEAPVGPNHALLVGTIMGACMAQGLAVRMLDTPEGVHTDEFLIDRPSGTWRVLVMPEAVDEP
jgi:hypothetical protein